MIFDLEGLAEPDDPGSGMPGLAQLVAVHPQHQPEQRPVPQMPGDAHRPPGPARGGGQPLIGQQVPQRDPERHPRLGQQAHRLWFGVPGRDAGFQPGDQRPQLADRLSGPAAVPGDPGQPDDRGTEREHRGEVGVVRPAIPSTCGGMTSVRAMCASVPRPVRLRRPDSIIEM